MTPDISTVPTAGGVPLHELAYLPRQFHGTWHLCAVVCDRARNCLYCGQRVLIAGNYLVKASLDAEETNASGRTQLKRARINPESQQGLAIHQRTWSALNELAPAAHDGAARRFVVVVAGHHDARKPFGTCDRQQHP